MSVTAEQLKRVHANTPLAVLGQTFIAVIVTVILYGDAPGAMLAAWCAFTGLALAGRGLHTLRYRRQAPDLEQTSVLHSWLRRYQVWILLNGAAWGFSVGFADYVPNTDFHFMLMAIGFGLAGTAVATLAPVVSIYLLFAVPMLGAIGLDMMVSGEVAHFEGAIAVFLGLAYLVRTAYHHSRQSVELILRNQQIEKSQLEILARLGKAGELRDNETGQHIQRMSYASYLLAQQLGLPADRALQIRHASPMHDVGKIGIPDYILLKPGRLSDEEWEIMKTHTSIGRSILDNHDSPIMQMAARIAECHHERWDGSGYPNGLSGEDIPLEARIVSICDVFDALTSERPYKHAWPLDQALDLLRNEAGRQFDPLLVERFLEIVEPVVEYSEAHRDSQADFQPLHGLKVVATH